MVVTPEWISKDFLQNALRKHLRDEHIHILGFTSSAAIPVGENYTSNLLRICITYATGDDENHNSLSVIVKCCPNNEMLMNYAQTMRLFEQEIDVYTEVFPAINSMSKNLMGVVEQLSAKCVHFTKEPQSSIMLEDLTAAGFKMHPRQQGLNLQHCLLAVEKLACFHAASAVVFEKDPSLIIKYNLGIFWENDFTVRWITTGFRALTEACAEWPGFEKYGAKLKLIQNQAAARTFTAVKRKVGDLSVLNHGDAWINNFMFLYAPDGIPTDFRLVDFQVPMHSSPALDFNFFWATSPNTEVRNHHFDTVVDCYYAKLLDTLTKLHYSATIPNRAQFRKELDSRAFYGLAAAVTVLPLVVATKRDDASFDDLFAEEGGKDSFRHDAYNNERYKKCMEYLLPFYDHLRILD